MNFNKHLILSLVVMISLVLAQGAFADTDWTTGESTTYKLTGNVGIGTTSPSLPLEVYSTVFNHLRLNRAGSDYWDFKVSTNDYLILQGNNSSYIEIRDSGAVGKVRLNTNGDSFINGGNVGIGTTSPSSPLNVVGSVFPVGKFERTTAATTDTKGALGMKVTTSGNMIDGFGPSFSYFIEDSAEVENAIASISAVRDGADNTGAIAFKPYLTGAATEVMRLKANGNVGIGTASPTNKLHVAGNGYFTGTVTTGSSRCLKKGIESLNEKEAIKALQKLKPIKFFYKANDKDQNLGFIAEDVPELVARKDRKSLSSMDLVTLSIKVIQEQQDRIEQLEKAVANLNNNKI